MPIIRKVAKQTVLSDTELRRSKFLTSDTTRLSDVTIQRIHIGSVYFKLYNK